VRGGGDVALEARDLLLLCPGEHLHEPAPGRLDAGPFSEEEAEGDGRAPLLAERQVARQLVGDLARGELHDAGVRLPPGGMGAHHREVPAPHRGADVHATLPGGHHRARPRHEAAHAAGRVRDDGERSQGAVAAELELEGLAVLRVRGEQHAAHQRAAEGRRGGGRGLVAPRRLGDQLARDERQRAHAAGLGDAPHQLVTHRGRG
jgi:hypothetical protein